MIRKLAFLLGLLDYKHRFVFFCSVKFIFELSFELKNSNLNKIYDKSEQSHAKYHMLTQNLNLDNSWKKRISKNMFSFKFYAGRVF